MLTARWCGRLGGQDGVVSGAGLWPLLALLASAADEPAGAELAAALGRPAAVAGRDALELLEILRSGASTTAALGLWAREGVPLRQEWASRLPAGVVETLTDQGALDRWAASQTDGLIDRFPLDIDKGSVLVLASALAARVRWKTPFESSPRVTGDTWSSDDMGPPDRQWLSRTTSDLRAATVLDGTVTRVVVEGDGDVDVHLLMGGRQPAAVLGAGLRALSGQARVRRAAVAGGGGPGLTVRRVQSVDLHNRLNLSLPSFEVTARHDLLEHPELFGLGLVTDRLTSHLPGLSPVPLYVAKGAQEVVARFFAEGFEAAAVTALGGRLTGIPPELPYTVTVVDAFFQPPFGFLAVHRPTRLAVVAGWVASAPWRSD